MKAGDKVAVGDALMVMIAMKMEVRRTPAGSSSHSFSPLLDLSQVHKLSAALVMKLFVLRSIRSGRPSQV